jgi:hypothetical protein
LSDATWASQRSAGNAGSCTNTSRYSSGVGFVEVVDDRRARCVVQGPRRALLLLLVL